MAVSSARQWSQDPPMLQDLRIMTSCLKMVMCTFNIFLLLLLLATPLSAGEAGDEESHQEPYQLRYQGIPHDSFYDMCSTEGQAYVVGAFGAILVKAELETDWTPLERFSSQSLFGIACNEDTILSVGQEGSIYRKQGQDDQWLSAESGTEERLLSVDMNSQGLAIAVGGFGTVLRSQDGGENWEALKLDWEAILGDFIEPHVYDIDVKEDGSITMVGEFELVLHSDDGGENWNKVHSGEASLFSLHFSDQQNAYAVGQNGTVLQTTDGGLNWQGLTVPTSDANLLGVWSSPKGKVFITGIRVLLSSDEAGQSWDVLQNKDALVGWYQPVMQADAEDSLYIAGYAGRIVRVEL